MERFLEPGGAVVQPDEEYRPDGVVRVVRLPRPHATDPRAPPEVVDGRVDVVEEEHVGVAAQVRAVDDVLERVRVDDRLARVDEDLRLRPVLSPPRPPRTRPRVNKRVELSVLSQIYLFIYLFILFNITDKGHCLQCFDTVNWVGGRKGTRPVKN